MTTQRLYFSLGPVQGFVAASRRTRDLWAGSWLLSHLADQAVTSVASIDGVALLLPAQTAHTDTTKPIAGTPNRLIVEGPAELLIQAAKDAADAIMKRWRHIANAVWKKHLKSIGEAHSDATENIWKRQVEHFWEITWVVGSDDYGRKAWRIHPADIEPGFRCALFPHLQELSGAVGLSEKGKLIEFWRQVRESAGEYDLDENEALSAIGLIKRFYPRLEDFSALEVTSWPSTAWVAALPWIKMVKDTEQAEAFCHAVEHHSASRVFDSTAAARARLGAHSGTFPCLDGQLLYERGIAASCRRVSAGGRDVADEVALEQMMQPYQQLTREPNGKPTPWFAVLVMDGDQMGKVLGKLEEDERSKISAALGVFAMSVTEVVSAHNGWTVYAGGDDVLALLPAVEAIRCAQALRLAYLKSFADQLGDGHQAMAWVSISGGLVFADWKTPLRQVLSESHHLLDDVAKDATGRDALAISVWLASGKACQWSAPWGLIGDEESGLLADLLRCGRPDEVSAGFLYGVRESMASIFDRPHEAPGAFAELPNDFDLAALITGDLVRIHGDQQRDQHKQIAEALSRLSKQHRRTVDDQEQVSLLTEDTSFSFDGLRLARFLAKLQGTPSGDRR